ncbi:Leucine-rich repeat domain, L domain-like [Phytophthora cactorum]|nr:Leucine-rich repeat domain, L domain-like [Phytophthora cactorum]
MMDVVWTLCMRLDRNLELLNNINRKYDMIGRSDASTSSVAMRVENEDELLLIAADEQLSSLEDVVRVMPTAQYLNVAMTELRSLDVSHNAVESLQELATLSKLLVLKCSSNQIADLSWIAGLNYLEELWIRDNRIESAQLAYLQQLTALQTLVIHPNPCTEQDDYVYGLSSSLDDIRCSSDVLRAVLPWLQRVDTIIITEELREEARHAEERGALDSGATDCSLFLCQDDQKVAIQTHQNYLLWADPYACFYLDPRMSEDSYEDRVASLPAPPAAPPNYVATTQEETEDNQNEIAKAEQVFVSIGNSLQGDNKAKENLSLPTLGIGGGLLDSVLTLPTFDNDSFLKKKKNTHYQLPGSGKPKQRVKPKSAAVSLNAGPNPSLSFYQDQEYTVAYPNSTVTAIQVRCDGSAIARWPSGSVAISVDFETSADRRGYRAYAAHRDGQLALSFDPAGVGFLNAYPSGKALLSTTSDGDDGTYQPTDSLGNEPDGSLLCRLSEHLAVSIRLTHSRRAQPGSTNDKKQDTHFTINPIALRIYFAATSRIRHEFTNSANRAEPCDTNACDYALGKASSKDDTAKTVRAKPPPLEHVDLLSSIRAAVAGL